MKLPINLFFLFLFVFAGCKKCPDEREFREEALPMKAATHSQVLKLNLQGNPSSLDPHTGVDLYCRTLQKALFEGLTRIASDGKPELALAERVEMSPAKTTYTFHLKKSYWSNGEKLKATHFENAWKRALSPSSNTIRSDLFYPIKNAKKAKEGKVGLNEVGVRALDDSTLVVELENPIPYFLEIVALPIFSPLYAHEDRPTVFNGPFVLEQWDHDKQLILAKNSQYWDAENVQLQHVVFSLIADANTALLSYEKGEVHWAGSPLNFLPIDCVRKFQEKGKLTDIPIGGVYWISCNTQFFPLSSAKIRKALSLCLNREEISNHLITQPPFFGIVPSGMYRHVTPSTESAYNQALAKQLFEEGLVELHLTRADFPVLELTHSDVPGQKQLSECFAESWKTTLGIDVKLAGTQWNNFFDKLRRKNYQMGGCIWYSAFNDPIYFLDFFRDLGTSYNVVQWHNEEYSRLLDLAEQEGDYRRREEFLVKAEKILMDEMPVIPVFLANSEYMVADQVRGISILPTGTMDFKYASVAHE